MDYLNLKNLIAGKEVEFGGKLRVSSEFYPNYSTQISDSTIFDIKMAISKAKTAAEKCNQMPFEERRKILQNAAKKISFNSSDLEYIVRYTGMPITQVKKQTGEVKAVLEIIPELIEKRIGIKYGKIARKPIDGENFFKFLHPIDGFLYAVTPANDPRVTAFVSAWAVSLGIPVVFKTASTDVLTAQKIIRAILDCGYPDAGLNQVCWDTKKIEKRRLNFDLVDSATAIWAFGEDKTVDAQLRFEESEGSNVDHFANKIILRHASGRSAGIYDDQYDNKKAAEIIAESALDWPIACNSMKTIFDTSTGHELVEELKEKFSEYEKYIGDPLKETTKVGYVNPRTNNHVYARIQDLERLGIMTRLKGIKIEDKQTSPILLQTDDVNSEFLNKEYGTYILAVKHCATFDDAVNDANYSAGDTHRLALSVFSDEEDKILKSVLRAHHIKRARHSTELDLMFHEGNDYLHKLTIPQIHRVSF